MFLTFRSCGSRLAVPLSQTREVLEAAEPLVLPGGQAWLHGIVLREGVAVPIVDLAALAGGQRSTSEARETVVVDAGELRLALLVSEADAAEADGEVTADDEAPEGWTWLSGRVMVGGHPFWVLDPEAVARSLGV